MHVPGCPRHGAEGAGGVVLTGENDTIEANFNACQNVEERDKTPTSGSTPRGPPKSSPSRTIPSSRARLLSSDSTTSATRVASRRLSPATGTWWTAR